MRNLLPALAGAVLGVFAVGTPAVADRTAARVTAPDPLPLTMRQQEILRLVRLGMPNKRIGRILGISEGTVRKHLENTFERLGVHSRTAAVAVAFGDEVAAMG